MISQYIQRYKATKYDWCDLGDVLIDAVKILTPKQYEKLLTKLSIDTELANCYITLAEDRKENGSLDEQVKRTLEQKKAEDKQKKKEAREEATKKKAEEESKKTFLTRLKENAKKWPHDAISQLSKATGNNHIMMLFPGPVLLIGNIAAHLPTDLVLDKPYLIKTNRPLIAAVRGLIAGYVYDLQFEIEGMTLRLHSKEGHDFRFPLVPVETRNKFRLLEDMNSVVTFDVAMSDLKMADSYTNPENASFSIIGNGENIRLVVRKSRWEKEVLYDAVMVGKTEANFNFTFPPGTLKSIVRFSRDKNGNPREGAVNVRNGWVRNQGVSIFRLPQFWTDIHDEAFNGVQLEYFVGREQNKEEECPLRWLMAGKPDVRRQRSYNAEFASIQQNLEIYDVLINDGRECKHGPKKE